MKRIFTFLIAFLATMSGVAWGQEAISGSHTTTITPSNGETITLDNANIDVSSGYALDMSNATEATLKIVGECTMTAQSGAAPAVYLPLGKTLTIVADAGANAILRIKGNDNVQTVTDGENKNKPKLGEIIIQSGTVYILGDLRHDEGHPTAQVQGGVAFIDGNLPKKGENTGGILFGRVGETWSGNLYQDYTINSNVQADIDGDPNTSDDINLNLNNHTLTLGDGVVIDTRNDHFVVSNGTIQAFTVTYNANPATTGDRTSTVPTNPSYYGTKASVRLEEGITCEGNASSTHEFLGWVKRGETAVHSAVTGTITTPDQYEETPRTENINIDAAWATKSLTITVKENESIVNTEATTLADTPDGTVTYESVNGTLPTGINLTDNTFTGTPESGTVDSGESKEYSVTVPYSYSLDGTTNEDKSTSVKIIVVKNTVTIDENATITFVDEDGNGTFLYDGKEHSQNIIVTVNNVSLTEGVDFTVSYSYTSEDNKTTNQTASTVKNAGTYIISSITGKNNATGTISNPQDQSGNPLKVVVTPRKLKFQAVSRTISLDDAASFALTPTYYDQTNNLTGTIMLLTGTGIDGFAAGEAPTSPNWGSIFSGALEIQNSPITTVGEYTLLAANGKVNITDATPFLTNNYTAEFTDDGKLTVTDTLDDGDVDTEIENNDEDNPAEFEGGTITLTYDGLSHAITSVKKKGSETVLTEETDYTISYTYKANAEIEGDGAPLDDGDEVKDAGIYTATISFNGNYSESDDVTRTIIINKRPLTITALEQTIYVGTEDESKQKEVNKTPTFGQEEGNTLTVSNIVSISGTAESVTFSTDELGLSDAATTAITAKTPGKYTEAITQGDLALADDNDANANYTISTDEGATFTAGDLIIIRVLGEGDKDDITGGDDGENKDGNFNDDGDYQLIGGDGEDIIYNGQPYEVKDLYLKVNDKATKISDFKVTYAVDSDVEDNPAELSGTDNKQAINAGHYTATIKITSSTETDKENYFETSESESLVFDFEIKPAQLTVTGTYQCEIGADLSSGIDISTLTLTKESFVGSEDATFSGTITLKDSYNTNAETEQTDAFDCTSVTATANGDGNAFKASNYDITYNISLVVGKITINPGDGGEDGDDITGGEDGNDDGELNDDEEDFIMIVPEGEGEISIYDGEPHGLSLLIIKKDGIEVPYILKETTDYTVTYEPQDDTKAVDTESGKPIHAGSYTATVTLVEGSKYQIKDSEDNSFTLTVQIAQRPLEVYLNVPATIKENQNTEDLSSWWSSSKITFNEGGFANDNEKDAAVGTLSDAKASIEGELPEVGQTADVKLMNIDFDDADPFFKSNYTITYYKGSTKVEGENVDLSDEDKDNSDDDASIDDGTTVDDSDKIEIDPDGSDTTGGEDENNDGDLDETNDFILLSPDGETSASVYDGEEHALTVLKFGTTILNVGDDYTVSGYTSSTDPNVGENSLPKHAATYSATVTLTGDYVWDDNSTAHTFTNITINKRPMFVSFVKTVSSVEDLKDINKLVVPEKMNNNRGLVTYESPIFSGEIEEPVDLGNGTYRVTIKRETFKISTNEAGNFYLSDYTIHVDTNGSGSEDNGDGEITEGEGGNEGEGGLGDGDDIVIDIEVDPNGEDNDGDGYIDRIDYYNIYEDQICEGVTVEFSRDVVREGQSVLVTIKADEGIDTSNMTLKFKRSLFGYWEDLSLTPTENPNEYIIKNIYTDIYVRIEGAVPTGIDEITGAKVYTKDGSLFVQTPQQEQVLIISMTGAIVKNETQIGLRQYTGLNRGIYIVCIGDERFKVRL